MNFNRIVILASCTVLRANLGGVDGNFFLNMKVQRMIIFLRADHFNALWGENNYYSAPFTPFRDFKIQLGLKWYLFT